jgi:hypothetical protein
METSKSMNETENRRSGEAATCAVKTFPDSSAHRFPDSRCSAVEGILSHPRVIVKFFLLWLNFLLQSMKKSVYFVSKK